MYLMIRKGKIAQKRPYWGGNRLKSKIKDKYEYPVHGVTLPGFRLMGWPSQKKYLTM